MEELMGAAGADGSTASLLAYTALGTHATDDSSAATAAVASRWSASDWAHKPDARQVGPPASDSGIATGLVNLTATCYLNATLQQLFAVQSFRDGLLALDVGEDETTATAARAETGGKCTSETGCDNGDLDSLLFQLQRLFAHLQENRGGGKAGDTKQLCAAFRDWDGNPIDPRRQQDATEFLGNLFQQLESRLAGTRHARLMQAPFGVTTISTLNADPVKAAAAGAVETFSSRRNAEHSLQVPLTSSKDDRALEDGLLSSCLPEAVDYKWPVASSSASSSSSDATELPTVKRQMLGGTPPHLLLSLSRFAFDMATLTQCKRDERVAFPYLVDMYQITPNGQRARRRAEASKRQPATAASAAAADDSSAERKGAAASGDESAAANEEGSSAVSGEHLQHVTGALWDLAMGSGTADSLTEEADASDDMDEEDAEDSWERLGDGSSVPSAASCVYALSGVVVHRGTAQYGHYWSLVRDRKSPLTFRPASAEAVSAAKERGAVGASALGLSDETLGMDSGSGVAQCGQWFKLDDRTVSQFDLSDMETEAFGGDVTSAGQKRTPEQSAFMLVYDQVDPATVAAWARQSATALGLRGDAATAKPVSGVIVGLSDASGTEPAPDSSSLVMPTRSVTGSSMQLPASVTSGSPMPRALFQQLRADRLRSQYLAQVASPAVLEFAMNIATMGDPPVPAGKRPDDWIPDTASALLVAQLAARLSLQVLPKLNSDHRTSMTQWSFVLERLCKQSQPAAQWLVQHLGQPAAAATLEAALLTCPHEDVRAATARAVSAAIRGCGVSADERHCGLAGLHGFDPAASAGGAGDAASAGDASDAAETMDAGVSLARLLGGVLVPMLMRSRALIQHCHSLLTVIAAGASKQSFVLWGTGAVGAIASLLTGDGPLDEAAAADAEAVATAAAVAAAADAEASPGKGKEQLAFSGENASIAAIDDLTAEVGLNCLIKLLGARDTVLDAAADAAYASAVLLQCRCLQLPRVMASLVVRAQVPEQSRLLKRLLVLLCHPSAAVEAAAAGTPGKCHLTTSLCPSAMASGSSWAFTEYGRTISNVAAAVAELIACGDGSVIRGCVRVVGALCGAARCARYAAREAVALREAVVGAELLDEEDPDPHKALADVLASASHAEIVDSAAGAYASAATRAWMGAAAGDSPGTATMPSAATRRALALPLSSAQCAAVSAGSASAAATSPAGSQQVDEGIWRLDLVLGSAVYQLCRIRECRSATGVGISSLVRLAGRSLAIRSWMQTANTTWVSPDGADGATPAEPGRWKGWVWGWWVQWLEATSNPRSLPAKVIEHKRASANRKPATAAAAASSPAPGARSATGKRHAGGGGGTRRGAVPRAKAKTDLGLDWLDSCCPAVLPSTPGWASGLGVDGSDVMVAFDGVRVRVTEMLRLAKAHETEGASSPWADVGASLESGGAVRSGLERSWDACIASDDEVDCLDGLRLAVIDTTVGSRTGRISKSVKVLTATKRSTSGSKSSGTILIKNVFDASCAVLPPMTTK
jgi:hypothetical protein